MSENVMSPRAFAKLSAEKRLNVTHENTRITSMPYFLKDMKTVSFEVGLQRWNHKFYADIDDTGVELCVFRNSCFQFDTMKNSMQII